MVDDQSDTSKEHLACETCHKQFGRYEHLKRHELSHESPKFRCSSCGKAFVRKDGLERHKLTHRASTSLIQKKARACLMCASAKVRCSGERPACRRCSGRRWLCSYPPMDDAQQDSSSNRSNNNHHSPQETYAHSIGLATPYQPVNGSLSGHDVISSTGMQRMTGASDTPNMGGYMNDWDNSMFNINWLPLHPIELGLDDANVHFPFQQTVSTNNLNNQGGLYNNVDNNHQNAAVVSQTIVGHISPMTAEHAPQSNISASPASVLNSADSVTYPESPAQTITSGEFYVDGNGARLPHVKRRRITSMSYARSVASSGMNLGCSPGLVVRDEHAPVIGDSQYAQIQDLYQRLCLMSNFFRPFVESQLLPRSAFSNLIDSFLTNVHPLFPIFHLPTFRIADLDACLILALAALGAHHHEVEDGEALSLALLEFLRRIFLHETESSDVLRSPSENFIQAQLWYVIGAKFSGTKALEISGDEILKKITSQCLSVTTCLTQPAVGVLDKASWRLWARSEEQRRTRFSVWLVDSIIAAEERTDPVLGLSAISHLGLPCHEAIWAAASVSSLVERIGRYQQTVDVSTVLQNLYMNKKLLPDLGEFAQLLVVHTVIQRTREARSHLQHELAGFEPTAERRPAINDEMQSTNRRRSIEAYQRWKNAACDCIDILHWNANAMIGAASGMEHPGVLHLHFARVVLLSPTQEIVALAKHLSHFDTPNALSDGISLQARQQPIRQWMVEDSYKARLAAIHAGVVFWHVRRYSANAFYEPGVVAQSTLMLWALSAFSHYSSDTAREQVHVNSLVVITEPPPPDTCDIILIDRPTDDVLVQQFVRQGQSMQAIMTGVGNLFGPLGPQRVLREGYKLISSLDSWKNHGQYWSGLLRALDVATTQS